MQHDTRPEDKSSPVQSSPAEASLTCLTTLRITQAVHGFRFIFGNYYYSTNLAL